MKVTLNIEYDPNNDPNIEAYKLDRFRQRIYNQGRWSKREGQLEILL